jgi:hypothetical protein
MRDVRRPKIVRMHAPLSKTEIASRQLFSAIKLYMEGGDLVSVVTLAGASDEILGKLVREEGSTSALDDAVERLCGMYEAAFGGQADRKKFVELRNHARNEFKHIASASDYSGDLARESVSMIRRAIENYKKLQLPPDDRFRQFQAEWLRRDRAKRPVV